MKQSAISPVKFLLVDDRDQNLVALQALLVRDGLELFTARSGDEALELLLVHDFALAILDVQMPEMDGFALAELMRGSERSAQVPIIFLTAGASDQQRVFQGYDAGAVDFLVKPLDPRILRHKTEVFFQLYRQKQELAETLRLNEMFVAIVGHDLRNPVNAIVMAAEILLATTGEPSTRKVAERLRSSGRRMALMIDDLFDLARGRLGGGVTLDREVVDLGAVVRRVVAESETGSPGRAISLRVSSEARAELDARRIEQVVSNLVGNALRHGAADAPVVVSLDDEGDALCLVVSNGGAISNEVLPHIFDPFRRGERTRERRDGLGLGLYIVQQIVLSHAGTVSVRSSAGEGTMFSIRLPKRAVLESSTASGAPALPH